MLLTTEQAAARLRIRRETLYAYVSRGLIASHKRADGRSAFRVEDVDRLAARSRRRTPAPVRLTVESAVTQVVDRRPYHRGRDAVELCQEHPFEAVAEFLWTGRAEPSAPWPTVAPRPGHATLEEAIVKAPPGTGVETARALLTGVVEALGGRSPVDGSFSAGVWSRLTDADPTPELLAALDLALGLSADHGLTRSSLVARIVASSGADLRAVVAAALGPSRVAVRGAAFADARRLLAGANVQIPTSERYPQGDPRTAAILEALPETPTAIDRAIAALPPGSRPAELALVALEQVAGFREGAAETIAVVARMAGWIAHALEEYANPTPYRVQEVYTGPPVQPKASGPRRLDAVLGYLERLDAR